ncbi:MAG: hypothetical protein KIC77_06620 [Clostridiales bacterium]|jgi:hypothetical protein|nr:hypothetical protein [Clostridiales bacterium]
MLTETDLEDFTLNNALIGKRIRSARKEKHQTQEENWRSIAEALLPMKNEPAPWHRGK